MNDCEPRPSDRRRASTVQRAAAADDGARPPGARPATAFEPIRT